MSNLINFYDEIMGFVDERRAVDIVYLDLSKAFSTVSCKILIHKLMIYGLDEQAVRPVLKARPSDQWTKSSWRPVNSSAAYYQYWV